MKPNEQDKRLAEIRERRTGIAKRGWYMESERDPRVYAVGDHAGVCKPTNPHVPQQVVDALFIAHSPDDIDYLLSLLYLPAGELFKVAGMFPDFGWPDRGISFSEAIAEQLVQMTQIQQPASERFHYEAELKNRYSDAVRLLREVEFAFRQTPLHFREDVAAPVISDYETQAKRVATFLDEVASKSLSQSTSERCGECVWHRPDIETDGPCWWTTCGSQVVTNPIKFCPFCGQVIALQGVEEIAQPNI